MADRKKTNLTPWFPGAVKPARKGVYERKYGPDRAFSFWDGKKWLAGSYDLNIARLVDNTSWKQELSWRGLAYDPTPVKKASPV